MLHFQYTWYLLSLAALPVMILLYFLLVRWKRNAAKKIGDPVLVHQLTRGYSSKKFTGKLLLFIIGFALCCFAVAGLVKPDGTQKINRKGIDIMIALDVSKSMLAQDIKPSRLERAKQVISRIIDNAPDDKIGLVIFAGRAYLQMPMTVDHEAAKMYLASATPDDVPTQGTVISDALKMCYAAFNPKEKTYKSIILISDGEDHDDNAIKIAKQLGKEGIMVNTIGIGSPQGAPIMDPATNGYKVDDKGNTVITKLNEDALSNIAKNGNGLYQLYTSTNEVAGNVLKRLSGIGNASVSDSSYEGFKQYFQYLLASALLLLVVEFFISEKRKMSKKIATAFVFFLFTSNCCVAQNAKNEIVKGNEAYKKNNFDAAENAYKDALKIADNNTTASYNLGNALFRKDNADEAVKAFDNTIQNSADNATKEKAYYNKGVTYQKAKKLPECINAYENALMLNPQDEEARQNLQRALKEQKQQQQQQQQNQKNKKQDPKKDQQKQDQQNKQAQQKQDEQPKPKPSKLSKQEAEERLKSLLENEKALQDKLHKIRGAASADKPEKDW
ncbi:MAG: VWA domain-containing protein [Ginsengibacter sp.]